MKKLFLIVEGNSDHILLHTQSSWFQSFGFQCTIIPTRGKGNMAKTATKHCRIATLRAANNIIFLPDQDADACALVTRQRIGVNSQHNAVTIVIKRELEAWILADSQCIQDSHKPYNPAGQTDAEPDPKQKLHSILKHALGYFPTTVEAVKLVSPYFSIHRAATNNTSAKRFKKFIESTARSTPATPA